ncbi:MULTISPECIES: 2OG-Fe dioxygenase family protein [Vibrio]|uniref:Agglutination protein n=2 Tax=Vibrio TaxID=662 RepID=A0A7X4RUA7_9VIBR|nr:MULTISPECIES: 2OG-Fe dioxygenase family protein [Vibrio]MBF9000090.1 2OG-Fe dioxygenase family protein [Vibrio nitrifigilis]MZI93681.1 agglutination protein [Vibrio eleionomae]
MLQKHEHTLDLCQLSVGAVHQLAPSFRHLPTTEHADGKYRLRRYSVIRFYHGDVVEMDKHDFMQTGEINHFQGDVKRHFEPLLESTLHSEGLRELCDLFVTHNNLPDGQEIEIHQMRVSAIYNETLVSPEGVHQDGFDYIAIVGINRHNIVGGDVMLYQDSQQAPFFRKVLDDGDIVMLADQKLWHNACPIRAIKLQEEGHMDLLVLTAKGA